MHVVRFIDLIGFIMTNFINKLLSEYNILIYMLTFWKHVPNKYKMFILVL